MSLVDALGCRVSGATPTALAAYERALAAFQGWRSGAEEHLELSMREAPDFTMAHLMRAWMLVSGRDPQGAKSATSLLLRAKSLPANPREQAHLAALDAVLGDDLELGKARLGALLREQPRDALALQVAHVFDYLTGDSARLADRAAAVLPAWSRELPGYHAVLAMHAFGLVECGEYAPAEEAAMAALQLNPLDARAQHVMAHMFEMTDRPEAGLRWMNEHAANWSVDSVVATHCWWHLALFYLARSQYDAALDLYDRRVRAEPSDAVSDLIDAASLLWRIELECGRVDSRWAELAAGWASHIDDNYCSFSDLHAMLAFVGAGDWSSARQLEQVLTKAELRPTRHGLTTRLLGLPACRALIAYGRGDDPTAIVLLAGLPALAHRLGGSHAQRDVLHMTLLRAVRRIRRPASRQRGAAQPLGSAAA